MAAYQGYEVNDRLYQVIRYMHTVKRTRDDLQKQQISWDYLSVMAQLANVDNELKSARQEFNKLTGTLLNCLGSESLNKSVREYAFRAQVAINIIVRNLFERTADIGFLAQDTDIKNYLMALAASGNNSQQQSAKVLRARFQEYVEKYSVYDNVILLDPLGNVLLQLDDSASVTSSKDPLIQEALSTSAAYVEVFRASDLKPNQGKSLIYAFRVESDEGEPIGVVCLSFKLEDECKGIFGGLLAQDKLSTLLFLDASGHVVASSHPEKIALNYQFNLAQISADLARDGFRVQGHGSSDYLCFIQPAEAYQGYQGLGWYGFIMVSLDKVFERSNDEAQEQFSPALLASAMQGKLFGEETLKISEQANVIQNALNRSVWNGNVYQAFEKSGRDAAVSKVLLSEIKNTGLDTKHIFEASILEIQQTVLAATLKDCESRAALAMSILDRNLYERANDCRWWALTTTFRTLLAAKDYTADSGKKIQETLRFINGLYTVYNNLLVFDQQGKVIAVSNDAYQHLVGSLLTDAWVKRVQTIHHSQHYAVSEFEATKLYNGAHSYIFAAAVQSLTGGQVVGGVAIVFDSTPQFSAILHDVLPQVSPLEENVAQVQQEISESNDDVFAILADQNKMVIASTHPLVKVGVQFELENDCMTLRPGETWGKILSFQENYYAVGCTRSGGYREFKSASDQYQAPVFAFVLHKIGDVKNAVIEHALTADAYHQVMSGNAGSVQLATFYVGNFWLALKSHQVASGVVVEHLVPIHTATHSAVAGYILYKGQSIVLMHTAMLLGENQSSKKAMQEAIVVRVEQQYIGLTIDALGDVLDVDISLIQPVDKMTEAFNGIIREVVLPAKEASQNAMLRTLDIKSIEKLLAQDLQAV